MKTLISVGLLVVVGLGGLAMGYWILVTIKWAFAKPWTYGDGDYSCAVCGMGMKEPCKHWHKFQYSNVSSSTGMETPPTPKSTVAVDHD